MKTATQKTIGQQYQDFLIDLKLKKDLRSKNIITEVITMLNFDNPELIISFYESKSDKGSYVLYIKKERTGNKPEFQHIATSAISHLDCYTLALKDFIVNSLIIV